MPGKEPCGFSRGKKRLPAHYRETGVPMKYYAGFLWKGFFENKRSFFRHLPLIILSFALLYLSVRSIRGVWEINDTQVIWHGVRLGWERSPDIFRIPSLEGRTYLYPVTSVLVLMPLGWLPYHAAGCLFTVIRVLSLCAIFHVVLRWSRENGLVPERSGLVAAVFFSFLIAWRPLNNSFGNGQINIFMAALCVSGMWHAHRGGSRHEIFGGILIALAAAVKATPLMFVPLLFLHRKYRAVAASVVALLALFAALYFWFTPEGFAQNWKGWLHMSRIMSVDAFKTDRAISLHELVLSLTGKIAGGDPKRFYRATPIIWMAEALIMGVLFLFLRVKFLKGVRPGPAALWDTAMIALWSLLLTPQARKAHLSYILIPVFLILLHVLCFPEKGRHEKSLKWLILAAALVYIGGSGLWEDLAERITLDFLPFLSLVVLSIALCALASSPVFRCGNVSVAAGRCDSDAFRSSDNTPHPRC